MAPSSGEELKNMLNFSLSINNKPTAIRYPRDTSQANIMKKNHLKK